MMGLIKDVSLSLNTTVLGWHWLGRAIPLPPSKGNVVGGSESGCCVDHPGPATHKAKRATPPKNRRGAIRLRREPQ